MHWKHWQNVNDPIRDVLHQRNAHYSKRAGPHAFEDTIWDTESESSSSKEPQTELASGRDGGDQEMDGGHWQTDHRLLPLLLVHTALVRPSLRQLPSSVAAITHNARKDGRPLSSDGGAKQRRKQREEASSRKREWGIRNINYNRHTGDADGQKKSCNEINWVKSISKNKGRRNWHEREERERSSTSWFQIMPWPFDCPDDRHVLVIVASTYSSLA